MRPHHATRSTAIAARLPHRKLALVAASTLFAFQCADLAVSARAMADGRGGAGGGQSKMIDNNSNERGVAGGEGEGASVTERPKTGCPYVRAVQRAQDRDAHRAPPPPLTQADLLPLRGVAEDVPLGLFKGAPKTETDGGGLDLDKCSRQRVDGFIEHPGSFGRSPEFLLSDGSVQPPRNDPLRLPFLLSLLGFDAEDSTLTSADLGRVSRLAYALDEQWFVTKFGSIGAMDATYLTRNFFPAGEAVLAHAHLSDDEGRVKKGEFLALVNDGALSTAAERAGGKVSLPAMLPRVTAAMGARAIMPVVDAKYKRALAALREAAAAAPGGTLLDLQTGMVRRG
jgi:hypothetical protein